MPENKDEYYILDDVIPSSSRYVSTINIPRYSGFIKQEGQRLKYYIDSRENKNITITYKIRNIFTGEFVIEPPYITNKAGKVLGIADSNLLTFDVK